MHRKRRDVDAYEFEYEKQPARRNSVNMVSEWFESCGMKIRVNCKHDQIHEQIVRRS